MADVFVSYSRHDTQFVSELTDELRARGKEVFLDVDGLRDAEVFPQALRQAIEGADAFLFVISPESVASRYCEQEVQHASELNKRIVPVSLHPVPAEEVPAEIRYRNWIPATESDGRLTDRVIGAIDTDHAWERQHTRLTVRALEWDGSGRHSSYLLRGPDLEAAERWLTEGLGKDPGPTELEQAYLLAGRHAAARRQRALAIGALAVAAISLVLVVFALISRSDAVNAEATAKSQALAADSATQIGIDPELSVLLGIHAVETKPTSQAMFALRAALDASPIRARLPIARSGNCLAPGVTPASLASANLPTVAFSPAGDQLAEGLCIEREIRIADPLTGRLERLIRLGGSGSLFAYAGPRTVVVAPTGRLELINTGTGRVVTQGPRAYPQVAPVLDPVAPIVAVAEHPHILLWNFRDGAVRRVPMPLTPKSELGGIAFSPDGSRLAVAGSTTSGSPLPGVAIVSTTTGRVLAAATRLRSGPVTGTVLGSSVAFSPDGRRVYLADDGTANSTGGVQMLDARTLKLIKTLRSNHLNSALSVSVSPDGSRIGYAFGDGTGGVVSPSGLQLVSFPSASSGTLQVDVALSPTMPLAAESSADGQVKLVRATSSAYVTIPPPPGVNPGAIGLTGFDGSDLDVVNGYNDGRFRVNRWTLAGRPVGPPLVVSKPAQDVAAAFLSDDGRLLYVQDGIARAPLTPEPASIWNVAERRVVRTLPATTPPDYNTQFFLAGKFLDHDRLVAISVGAPAKAYRDELINVQTGAVRVLQTLSCPTRSEGSQVANSPDGRLVAFVHECGRIQVFDTTTGRRVGPGVPANGANSVAISTDGRLLASSAASGTITITRIATGKTVTALSQVRSQSYFLAFSPDGRYFAAGGQDQKVRIWDDRTWNELRAIGQPQGVFDIMFTANSRNFFEMEENSQIQEYDTCTDCENQRALVRLADTRVTRPLTPGERREFTVQ